MKVAPIRFGVTYDQAMDLLRQMFPKAMAFVEALDNGPQIFKDWLNHNPSDDRVVFRGYHNMEDHSVVNRRDYDVDVGNGECYTGVENFIYFRRCDIILNTIQWACHSRIMSGMYTLEMLEQGKPPRIKNWREASIQFWMGNPSTGYHEYMQDQYLYDELGFYQSSCNSMKFYIHENFKMTRKEKAEFEYLSPELFDFDSMVDNSVYEEEPKVEDDEFVVVEEGA